MNYKRVRSDCKEEEDNVSSYVDSCVNFSTEIAFHDIAAGKRLAEKIPAAGECITVLLLGSEEALKNTSAVKKIFPYYDLIAKEIESACVNEAHVAAITPTARILIGKVTSTASRHNCAMRPDKMVGILRSAASHGSSKCVHVYYVGSQGDHICLASAVARATTRTFTAKNGSWEKGYRKMGPKIEVVVDAAGPHTKMEVTALCVQLCQRLVDAPTNLLDTTTFTEIAVSWMSKLKAQGYKVGADVIEGEELRSRGYLGLYGTGKAAEYPPHLVTLSYEPEGGMNPQEKIAFVGKGIVYDTGGLAIKSRDGMCSMKHDMGGAAAVFCGFIANVMLGTPSRMSTILCLADNAVGPRAQRNDDILIMKSGVTVEINNTDAEGRLVLSDGVYHASAMLDYTPDIIVDMATLTGAQGIATGRAHAAIYANTDESERRFVQCGRACGDLCFPVVYCPELHNEEFTSAVADFCNSVKRRDNAQVSCAGQFIGNNLSKEYKGEWVHVDLAAPATSDQATGFGVALLIEAFARKD